MRRWPDDAGTTMAWCSCTAECYGTSPSGLEALSRADAAAFAGRESRMRWSPAVRCGSTETRVELLTGACAGALAMLRAERGRPSLLPARRRGAEASFRVTFSAPGWNSAKAAIGCWNGVSTTGRKCGG